MKNKQTGFTLIEIAIVLVIIGLLLGGVLKGQELITGARVRNLIQQQDGVKAAYFGFLDRYRALPGDFSGAKTAIKDVSTNGDGNGKIELKATGDVVESILSWEHLAKAGFINGSYTYDGDKQNDSTNPKNPYGGFLQLVFDKKYGDGSGSERHNLKTGPSIPVEILGEIDRKTDDGMPQTGSFQSSEYSGASATCVKDKAWDVAAGVANCGGATLY
jgi:prepilin-type N-terminal cleavage/methylation domain-containing protein